MGMQKGKDNQVPCELCGQLSDSLHAVWKKSIRKYLWLCIGCFNECGHMDADDLAEKMHRFV
jgi:uncharacterized Zn finger protein